MKKSKSVKSIKIQNIILHLNIMRKQITKNYDEYSYKDNKNILYGYIKIYFSPLFYYFLLNTKTAKPIQ